MTFAKICKFYTGRIVRRQTLSGLWSCSTKSCADFPQTVTRHWYSCSAPAALTRSMQKTVALSRCFSVTTVTSLFSLLVVGGVRKVDTPLLVSHRHHSDSESDSEGEEAKSGEEAAAIMQKPEIPDQLKRVKEETVYGMLVADAVAMPVHWYYNPPDIKKAYGQWLTGYTAPNKKHPSSILNLSAVDGSGRGTGSSVPLIGNIILHDKVKFWEQRSTHYHQGMSAGDNTLNAVTAMEMLKTMNRVDPELTAPNERDVQAAVLEDYVRFMTTPGTHNDTYAESFHRSFFKDWVQESPRPTAALDLIEFAEKRSRDKTSGRPDSQLSVIGALVPAIPWIVRAAHRTESQCAKSAVDFIRLTHPVTSLVPFVDVYARLLHAVMNGLDLKAEVLKVLGSSTLGGPGKREMVLSLLDQAHRYPKGSEERLQTYQRATGMLGSACYIDGAMSSMLFLALEFHDDFKGGVLANANCGGENCHRGAALGALLAAAAAAKGKRIPAELRDNLHSMKPVAAAVIQDMNDV
ncbi:uncharacterized protein LOC143288786 [Babylonia areolata]|uniref:uncharacterized protein LOC143288786 n=1 Tax=Babylonia areolata TaxID=304850 RepID=UPI003FCF0E56